MKKRKTHEEFLEELKLKRPNITPLGKYEYSLTKMKFSCNECNYEWYATPASVLSHNKCPNFRQHQDYINHNYVDLTGKEYKYLKVIEQVEDYISSTGTRLIQWKCQCKCGNIVFRTTSWLNGDVNQSCGCMRAQAIIDRCTEDLIGQKFGKLLVVKYAGSHKDGAMWECQCDCGNMIIAQARYLKRGSVKSCGCLQSYGEETIANFLDENQIAYVRQKNI